MYINTGFMSPGPGPIVPGRLGSSDDRSYKNAIFTSRNTSAIIYETCAYTMFTLKPWTWQERYLLTFLKGPIRLFGASTTTSNNPSVQDRFNNFFVVHKKKKKTKTPKTGVIVRCACAGRRETPYFYESHTVRRISRASVAICSVKSETDFLLLQTQL